jgi:hypothetical protein
MMTGVPHPNESSFTNQIVEIINYYATIGFMKPQRAASCYTDILPNPYSLANMCQNAIENDAPQF